MCGGGVGSANDSSNDDEKGSGNSFKETLANIFTPGDGMSYVDGQLTEDSDSRDKKFYDYSAGNNNDDGPGYANIMVDGKQRKIRRDANDAYKQKYASALFGAATGGLPGLIGGLVTNKITQGATGQAGLNIADTVGDAVSGLRGLLRGPDFEAGSAEEAAYRKTQAERRDAAMESMMASDNNDIPAATVSLTPTALGDTTGLPASTVDMSGAAAEGAFQPVPNPDYDPNDPMSPRFLVNPTYEQLLAYKQSQATGMAMGGMLDRRQISPAYMSSMMMTPSQQSGSTPPLELYRSYIEKKYGDPTFDRKRDTFLNEVHQKEKATFGGTDFGLTSQPSFDFFKNRTQPMLETGYTSAEDALARSGAGEKSILLPGMGVPGQGYIGSSTRDLLSFGPSLAAPAMGYAEGGEVTGDNEKTMIADAVSAVKGEKSQEESAVVLGQFLAAYGEDALRDLVDKVQSGELDDTVERFANGEAGEVNGPGDGSGVDDKVPASLEGQQDVLLADGEFVLRKKTADALEKKYGGGFLDAINEAENDAPRTMREYMAKKA